MSTVVNITTNSTWVAPAGVYSVDVECWGGGGSGAATQGGSRDNVVGGGGGGYSKKSNISVTPGNSYTVTVGQGGAGVNNNNDGNNGGDSWFLDNTTVLARGGQGGTGSTTSIAAGRGATVGIGDITYTGGNSGSTTTAGSSGGGGGAGSSGNGGASPNAPAGDFTNAGGTGGSPDGGNGSASKPDGTSNGSDFGGGSGATNSGIGISTGNGGNGNVRLTYTPFLVTTSAVTDIDFTTATGNGEVVSDGGSTITERGFVWNTTGTPTTSDNKVIVSGTTGVYSGSLTSLSINTLYYVRAYAINSIGTIYGSEVQFTTLSELDAQLIKDIDGVEGASYGVRIVVGGTTGSVTVSLGSTGDSTVINAGNTGVLIGSYSGLSGIIIEASNNFDGTIDDVFWVRLFDTSVSINWDLNKLTITYPISSSVFFRRIEDKDFNNFRIYRHLDIKLKDLNAQVTVNVKNEASDRVTNANKQFSVGTGVENTVPFLKKRISFLIKPQAILIGFSNNRLNETFTISEWSLSGYEQPRKLFAPSKIISM